jgi:hypothetical protein
VPSYWIAHPTESSFISALSPEGVSQFLMISRRWPAGRNLIREHHHGASPTSDGDRAWGVAMKDISGGVRFEVCDAPSYSYGR